MATEQSFGDRVRALDHSTFSTRMRRGLEGTGGDMRTSMRKGVRDGQSTRLISPVEHGAILDNCGGRRRGRAT